VDLDAFIAMTQRIVAQDGSEDYLPTLVLPAAGQVIALEGVPDNIDTETASRKWASETAGELDDYFLAFQINPTSFKAVARIRGQVSEQVAPFHPA
jgi:hypothetical protein